MLGSIQRGGMSSEESSKEREVTSQIFVFLFECLVRVSSRGLGIPRNELREEG